MELRQSLVALVVLKVKVHGQPYFLMRKNKSWGDVTFIGGHVEERDNGQFTRAAYRELLEEVPPFRTARGFEIQSITPHIKHGPVDSPSAGTTVMYDFQFFLVHFRQTPDLIIASLGQKSLNVLVAESELLQPNRFKIAALVDILDDNYPAGLRAIPYSWSHNLELVDHLVSQPALMFT